MDNLNELRKVAEAEPSHKWGQWTVEEDDLDGYLIHAADGGFGQTIVAKEICQGQDEGASTAKHIATFDPPTVLSLLSRLEQAEQAVARVQELREGDLCGHCKDTLDDALDGEQG